MPKDYDLMEIIRQKTNMSQQIVAKQGNEDYAYYSGADLETASIMATIDTFLLLGLIPKEIVPLIKLYRAYLTQQRKAFFASTCSEISKLGFILGMKHERIHVTTAAV